MTRFVKRRLHIFIVKVKFLLSQLFVYECFVDFTRSGILDPNVVVVTGVPQILGEPLYVLDSKGLVNGVRSVSKFVKNT